jgi:hypothetical protein
VGLFAKSGRLIVLCPEGFYYHEINVMCCERYLIVQVSTFADLLGKQEISRLVQVNKTRAEKLSDSIISQELKVVTKLHMMFYGFI